MNNTFKGIWVPVVTPFLNGAVDFAALPRVLDYLKDGGVTGIVVCGTTGEAAALADGEQLAVLDAAIEALPGLPMMMGLSGNNVDEVLHRMVEIQRRPIAGLLVPPPYYIRPSQEGLIQYFTAIANAAKVPVVLYNIPYRTGVALELSTIRRLAEHPNIQGIKDCSGDLALTMQLIGDGTLAVLAGEDVQILSTLCLGGAGAITAAAHVRPDLFVRLAHHVEAADLGEARRIFYGLLPLIVQLFTEPNPGPVKAVLAHLGLIADELRSPMQSASRQTTDRLLRELAGLDGL